eukprot:CAMPEP_0194291796 /NCGR_PEP_ID=MMETSP0169-20130528/44204_1 /TAXON_ID=218684 /ORGANISM="Corethron pennatum, Strain L29A3" /LENGTH=37 /DNA_ID= /DNA_START= /DNA_END= /DNA_ORIENTATION=
MTSNDPYHERKQFWGKKKSPELASLFAGLERDKNLLQ